MVGRRKKIMGPTPHKNVGRRLEMFRLAKRHREHKTFIASTGINSGSYADWENGKKTIGLSSAMKLIKRHPELSLDYIYLGRVGTIDDYELRDAIALMIAENSAAHYELHK